jgi:hypothetical protein
MERALAKEIACQDEPLRWRIPQCKSELAD